MAAAGGAGLPVEVGSLLHDGPRAGDELLPPLPRLQPADAALRLADDGPVLSHAELDRLLADATGGGLTTADVVVLPENPSPAARVAALAALVSGGAVVRDGGAASDAATVRALPDGGAAAAKAVRDKAATMWLGNWALGIAVKEGKKDQKLGLMAKSMQWCMLVVADVLFFPRLLSPVLGPRCTHILQDKRPDTLDEQLLRGMGLQLYHVNMHDGGDGEGEEKQEATLPTKSS